MDSHMTSITPINLLVIIRKAPKNVIPSVQTPNTVIRIPTKNVGVGYGSVLTSHLLLFNPSRQSIDVGVANQFITPHKLELSLRKVLVTYYPFAGRLYPSSSHEHLELVSNSKGVIYVEAQANISLLELKKLDKVIWSDFQYDFASQSSSEIPPLVIQVTTLTCGAFVVSIKMLQALCDSAGILHFLHAWSELTKYELENHALMIATPIWGGIIPTHEFTQLHQRLHYPSLDMDIEAHVEPHIDTIHYPSLEKLSNISISIENLIRLKDNINITCNKFEVLLALFWREYVRALSLPTSSNAIVFFPAPVPHDVHLAFYGQYAFNCMVTQRVNDLLEGDLASIIRSLHDAKDRLDHDSFVKCVKEFGRLHSTSRRVLPPLHVLIFTLLWKGVSEIDFGNYLSLHVPDVIRLHSPINVIAITGGLENTIELAMTNVPSSISNSIQNHFLHGDHVQSNYPNPSTSRL